MLGLIQANHGAHSRDSGVPGWTIWVMQPVEIAYTSHSVGELLPGILVSVRS